MIEKAACPFFRHSVWFVG